VHSLEWTPERIVIAVDGEALLSMNLEEARSGASNPLRQPMRLRINLALGGSWGGPLDEAALPAHFDIASIKVWRWQPGSPDDEVPEARPASKPELALGRSQPRKNASASASPEPSPAHSQPRRDEGMPTSPELTFAHPELQEAKARLPEPAAPLLLWGR